MYSIYTPVQDLPEDLYKELQDAFNKSDNAKEVDELDEYDDEGILAIFAGFVQTNPVAKDIIDAYNAKSTEKAEKEASDEIDEFEFKQGNKAQQTAKLTTEGLIAIRDQFKILRDKAKKAVKKEYYSDLINKLEKLISTRQRKGYTVEVQEKIKILKEKLVAQQKNIEKTADGANYKIKSSGKLLERVTNFLKGIKKGQYTYVGKVKVAEAFNDTIDVQGLTEDSIDEFMDDLDTKLLKLDKSGYTKDTIEDIESTSFKVRAYLENLLKNKAETPIKSKKELLKDIQEFISENAYAYTNKAGDYLDAQLRQFFTPGGKPAFDESEISREAFDEIFGPDSYISALKEKIDNRELFVLANNIKVFDEETGIAGEIDLLLIDKDGKLHIIDFKTGSQSKWNGFVDLTNSGKNKTEEYTLQQYTYARLLKKMTGLDAEINIMPLEITINQKEYKIYSVNQPTNTKLLGLDKWYFKLDPNFNDIKARIDAKIKIDKKGTGKQTPPPTSNQSDIEGQVGTSNYSVIDGLIFYNNTDTTVTPVPNTKGEDVLKVIKADIERRRQEELDSIISEAVLDDTGYKSTKGFKITGWSKIEVKDEINAKYDAELAALEPKADVKDDTQEPISDEDFERFTDDGYVSPEIINSIADKIKNNEERSIRELAILTYKTAEVNQRLEELYKLEQEKITKVSELTLKKGDVLIVKDTIFGKSEEDVFAEVGAKITVVKTTEKGVTFRYGKRTKTVSLSELDKHLTTMSIENNKNAKKANEKLDEIDKNIIAESVKVLKNFIKDDDAMASAQKDADDKKLADIYNDLLNNLDC